MKNKKFYDRKQVKKCKNIYTRKQLVKKKKIYTRKQVKKSKNIYTKKQVKKRRKFILVLNSFFVLHHHVINAQFGDEIDISS